MEIEHNYVKPIVLYDLFFTRPISNITLSQKRNQEIQPFTTPEKSKKRKLEEYSLSELEKLISPDGKKILKAEPRDRQLELARNLVADVNLIETKEMEEYKNDLDYVEKMENNGLGFYMENFMSYYGVCPVCKLNTLRKYSFSNMPVVDLICINDNYHTVHGGCFLFQVKTSLNKDNLYFNKIDHYITVGSMNYGYNAHVVKGSDDLIKKKLLIGYICLHLNQKSNSTTEYMIDTQKSFILLPDLNKQLDATYYSYRDKETYMGPKYRYIKKHQIKWNDNLVNTVKINECFDLNKTQKIDTRVMFEETDIKNKYIDYPLTILGDEWKQYKQSNQIPRKKLIYGGKRYRLVY